VLNYARQTEKEKDMSHIQKKFGLSLLASASIAALTPAVIAQDSDTPVLEEIIVTAQKRVESAQDVPVSVAAVAGEKLDVLKSAGADIRFLSSRVPSLTIESSFGRTFPRFYIRGLGNTDFDFNASQPVSLVYDEVVYENPILKGFPVFDLERIEVLRGPQGTLFGRNTPAGIVKFDSAKPSHDADGYVKAAYGRFNAVQLEGAFGGSIVDDVLAARVSAVYLRRDDFVDNTFTGEEDDLEGYDEFAARAQFLYTPGDNFSALLNVHGRTLDGTARVFRANAIQPGTNNFTPGFDRFEVATDGQNNQEVDSFGFVANLAYDFGEVTLTSITSYENGKATSVGDVDGGFGAAFLPTGGSVPFTAETQDAIPTLDQFTQEIRLSSNNWERTNFQLGLFYFDEDFVIQSTNFDTLSGDVNGFASQTQQAESYAAFASVDFRATDDLVLKVGARLTRDEKDFSARRTQSPLAFLGVGPLPRQTAEVSDTFFNWDISATYSVNDDVNVFARVATASRAPSIQGRVLFGDVVSVADTEDIISFEAGLKSELFENRVRFNLTGFYYDLDDQQVTAVGGETNFNTLLNVEDSRGFGFEAEVEALVTENLLVTAGVSLNDTEFQDRNLGVVPGAAAGLTPLNPDGTLFVPTDENGGIVSLDGNPFPQAPRWIANWTVRYSLPVGDDGEFYIFTDWAYRSRVNFVLYNSVELNDDVLIEGGVRAGYKWADGDFEVAAFGRNITNNLSLTGVIDFNNLTGFVNEPRTWGVEFISRF
jgi:iron complex outermembrane receptor protein